jgi:hypothetical protein
MPYWLSTLGRVQEMLEGGEGQKLRVFVSYSRKDASFVDRLVAGLGAYGFSLDLDRLDIMPGENWQARLGRRILGRTPLSS